MGWGSGSALFAAALAVTPAVAQVVAPPAEMPVPVTLADDAAGVAERLAISPAEAARQIRFQEASVPATDTIADRYAGRLAGIAVEHLPRFRIVVRLVGDEPVADEALEIDGERIEVTYLTGAAARHVELVQAITAHQAAIRASLLTPPGLGIDQRTGEIVAVVARRDVAREGADPLRQRLAALVRVPLRLRVVDEPALDMDGIAGGMRMMGGVPGDGRQYVCTAGFVVTDGAQEQVLPFEGQWGWGHQDVQINVSATPLGPAFYVDGARTVTRAVTGSRSRAGTRAGEIVCHRGERTGYSCSVVELTDFAPAGDLCGGACLPTWTTVAGPGCRGGDSGSPVFLGTTAYGILKGGSYRANGSCAFYFYMSTDYLPQGWRLLTGRAQPLVEDPVRD